MFIVVLLLVHYLFAEILRVHDFHQIVDRVFDHILASKDIIVASRKLADLTHGQMDLTLCLTYLDALEALLLLVLVTLRIKGVQLLELVLVRSDFLLLQEFPYLALDARFKHLALLVLPVVLLRDTHSLITVVIVDVVVVNLLDGDSFGLCVFGRVAIEV